MTTELPMSTRAPGLARDAAGHLAHDNVAALDPAERARIGVVLSAALPAPVRPLAATALSNAFIDTLADLHVVDYHDAGLADLGRPDGYLQRQLARWNKQLINSHSREIAGFPQLAENLNHSIPASRHTSIVHGDFRLD